eukprot:753934-Hanusia_phi.AAC.1
MRKRKMKLMEQEYAVRRLTIELSGVAQQRCRDAVNLYMEMFEKTKDPNLSAEMKEICESVMKRCKQDCMQFSQLSDAR